MWARNLLFLSLVGGGLVALTAALFPRQPPAQARISAPTVPAADFQPTVERVNEAFRAVWKEQGLQPAPPAPELLVARRLALGLMGTIPSLEEIRQLEAREDDRLQWYLDRILRDPRCH